MSQPGARAVLLAIALLAVLVGCGSSGDSATSGVDTTVAPAMSAQASMPAGSTAEAVSDALALAETAAACDEGNDWIDAAGDAAVALRRAATEARAEAAALDGWLFSDDAIAVADALQQALVERPDCPGALPRDVLAVTGQVTGAIDEYRTATTPGLLGLASGFWLNFDYLGHSIEIDRLQRQRGPVEVLVLGDSATKRGIDPIALDEASDRPTMNASVDGLLPTMVGPWFDELDELGVRPDVVIVGITTWGAIVPCDDPRPTLLAGFRQNRDVAFAGLGVLGEPAARRVVGRPPSAYSSPLLDRYRLSEGPGGQGSFQDRETDEGAVAAQVAYHTRLFESPVTCDEGVAMVSELAGELTGNGTRVVVAAMPVSDDMAALHPDGRAGHEAIADSHLDAARAAGAEVIDLTGALTDGHFHDPAHPNEEGRAILTDRMVALLA